MCSVLCYRKQKKVDHNRLAEVFERDIVHVNKNLQLQRKDAEKSINLGKVPQVEYVEKSYHTLLVVAIDSPKDKNNATGVNLGLSCN